MQITKVSDLTGHRHTLEVDVTPEQLDRWQQGMLIQDAMPQLNPDEREFIMTGITPREWEKAFAE